MADQSRPLAFFAIWKNKPSEYRATTQEEQDTSQKIDRAFINARALGVRMYGRYGCRWSTDRQYFTFWLCPGIEVLEKTMGELEAAGDFKFADSEHVIGVQMTDEDMVDKDFLAQGGPDEERPIGFFALWRQTESKYSSSPQEWEASDHAVRDTFKFALERGIRMLGRYDCRWSTQWQYFTFWQAPSLEVLDEVMDRLEHAGDFWLADSRHIIGNLEPDFRFGMHLRINPERADGGY